MYALKIGHLGIKRATEVSAVAKAIRVSRVIGLDIETGYKGEPPMKTVKGSGKAIDYQFLNPHTGEIRAIQFYLPALKISFMLTGKELLPDSPVMMAILDHVRDTDKVTAIHNALYEGEWFYQKYGVLIMNAFCTQIGHQLVTAGLAFPLSRVYGGANTLKTAVTRLLGVDISKDAQVSDWGGQLSDGQIVYALLDAYWPYRLYLKLKHVLDTEAGKAEMGAVPVFVTLNTNGIPASASKLAELRDGYVKTADEYSSKMMATVKELFVKYPHFAEQLIPKSTPKSKRHLWAPNLNSHAQVKKIINKLLEEQGRLPVESTNASVLERLGLPFAQSLVSYRTLVKLGQYAEQFLRNHDQSTGRVKCQYRVLAVQATGRSSASDGSLQIVSNTSAMLASHGLSGLKVAFGRREILNGRVMLKADFAASHAAIATDLSGDVRLIGCIERGEKLHYHTLGRILELMGAPLPFAEIKRVIETKDKEFRHVIGGVIRDYYWLAGLYTISKNTFYSFLNFAGRFSLQRTFAKKGILATEEECGLFLQACKEMYHELYAYQRRLDKMATSTLGKIFDVPQYDDEAATTVIYGTVRTDAKAKFLCVGTHSSIPDGRFIRQPAVKAIHREQYFSFMKEEYMSRPSQVVSSFWLGIEATIIKTSARRLFDIFQQRPDWEAEIVGFAHDELPVICAERYYDEVAATISAVFEEEFKKYAPHYRGDKIEKLDNWEDIAKV